MVWAELEGGQRWHDTDLSATVSEAFLHKGIFLASYKDRLRAKCGGERFESGETLLHPSWEDNTCQGSLLCMFSLCGRPGVAWYHRCTLIPFLLSLYIHYPIRGWTFLISTSLRVGLDVNPSSFIQIFRKWKVIFSLNAGLWPLLSHRRVTHSKMVICKNQKISLCCLLKNELTQLT